MSTGIDIKFVQERYAKMSDTELAHLVTTNADGLTPEALAVAKEEIKKRGMSSRLLDALDAQQQTYSIEEIDQYCNLINHLNCPVCGSSTHTLNATLTAEVMSFIILTQYKRKVHVGCPSCLDTLNNNALTKTITLGWWGVPWGIFRSFSAIRTNIKSKKSNHLDTPNHYLRHFTLANIGLIEAHRNDPRRLQQVIANVMQ
ncbi:hypothetical protein [Chitinophaga sp. Cy-1792]|uniref:hypothetical protein n=1 Tax=Chitinophaga sp. Cy-1792 TaxID=2608339 RepID=UPI001420E42B|nr:hypothetical protein [Chitinophaga sp. Cy-1792]NIG55704.1 hypothetical protein [Chitinophaga sp. Cy-1792]